MEQEVRTLGDVELTITVEKILELAKEVAKTTVNEINELEEKKREVYSPQKAAKKMLSDYRRLKRVATDEIQPTKEEAISLQWEYLRELMGNPDEKLYAEKVAYITELKLQYNYYKVKKIEKAVSFYKQECEDNGSEESLRRYRVIDALYMNKNKASVQEIAEQEHVSEKTIYKDDNIARSIIAIYLSSM